MTELDDRLRRLAERGEVRGADAVFEAASSRPSRPLVRSTRALVLVAVVLIAVVAVGAGLLVADDAPSDITAEVPPLDGVFDIATGTVLVFDDGLSGTIRVDLDRRTIERAPLDGQRPGDQPYRLHRTGDALVFGWGEVFTAPLAGTPSRSIGEGTVFVPALDDGTVWLVDSPALRRVDVATGEVVEANDGWTHEDAAPIREVEGGMAYDTPDGIVVWDPATGETSTPFPGGRLIGDVHGSKVAWCADPCRTLHVTDLVTGGDVTAEPTDPAFAINIAGVRFSPDGTQVAVQTAYEILLVDTATGERRVAVDRGLVDAGTLLWRDDGLQLYFAGRSYGSTMTELGLYDLDLDTTERRLLPFGGVLGGVAVPAGSSLRAGDRFEPCTADVDTCPTTTTSSTTTTTMPSTTPVSS